MQTCGKVIEERKGCGAVRVQIDKIGIGAGVVSRGVELHEPFVGINVGEAAIDSERFLNLRAEYYWALRERFEAGDVDLDPSDKQLASELCSIRFKRTSRGQIQIESKEDMKRRGIPSPNRAEAVMLAFAVIVVTASKRAGLLW
jgi:hypothetical protein